MGQIVRAIKGINEACKYLDYPVVSGNVSLYNETDGTAIQPTPAIGGVGLLKDLTKRSDSKFKNIGDTVFVVGKTSGHLDCSLYEREVLKKESQNNPPKVDLELEKKHGKFIRDLIDDEVLNACHDISDGGMLVALFEMCSEEFGIKISYKNIGNDIEKNALLFGEDQGRYILSVPSKNIDKLELLSQKFSVDLFCIGLVVKDKIEIGDDFAVVKDLQNLNKSIFPTKFN
jgi:phosphoribosylformylglycinamidine synthase